MIFNLFDYIFFRWLPKWSATIGIRNNLAFRIRNLDLLIRGSGSERNIYGSGTLPELYIKAEQSEVTMQSVNLLMGQVIYKNEDES
jgi:hypothetical protein